MNISQPSLTTAIRKLEDRLGGRLFLRDRAGCSLTPLGTVVLPHLREVLRQTERAMDDAKRYIRLEGHQISVGVGEDIGMLRIADAVARYQGRAPEIDFEIIVEKQDTLLNGLREGHFDIAITGADAVSDLYHAKQLYSETYRVVVSAAHPFSQRETVNLELLMDKGSLQRICRELREALFNLCAERGNAISITNSSNRIDWLLELVRLGKGFVILPETAIPRSDEFASLSIENHDFKRHVVALRYLHQPTRPEISVLTKELARPGPA